ncbi:hypothetical protein CPB85DRAFT_1257404 [Mucidula mucida]|nr:hypothetical protein CPB85DRAFT_1257404 [Mucidula mucida]
MATTSTEANTRMDVEHSTTHVEEEDATQMVESSEDEYQPDPEPSPSIPAKRKRGRPHKVKDPLSQPLPAKRPRGRPLKIPSPAVDDANAPPSSSCTNLFPVGPDRRPAPIFAASNPPPSPVGANPSGTSTPCTSPHSSPLQNSPSPNTGNATSTHPTSDTGGEHKTFIIPPSNPLRIISNNDVDNTNNIYGLLNHKVEDADDEDISQPEVDPDSASDPRPPPPWVMRVFEKHNTYVKELKNRFSDMLHVLHRRRYEMLEVQYLQTLLQRHRAGGEAASKTYAPFSDFDEKGDDGIHAGILSGVWCKEMYNTFMEEIAYLIFQYIAMLSAKVLAIDHSFKCKVESFETYGLTPPQCVFTDNMADKSFLEEAFPSLREGVTAIAPHDELEVLSIPDDVRILVQTSLTQIETTILTLVDSLPDDETSQLIIGLNTEWNVDLDARQRGVPDQRQTATMQIASNDTVWILQWLSLLTDHLAAGHFPPQLVTLLANPRVQKVGKNVMQDLRYLQEESKSQCPFVGGIDIAHLAKGMGVISTSRIGLADLCAQLLKKYLLKDPAVRKQIQYAALDAWASLRIYQELIVMRVPSFLSWDPLPPHNTEVFLYQDDQTNLIARGHISPLFSQVIDLDGINITKTRTIVRVVDVFVPGAILTLYNKKDQNPQTLSSFGAAPFDVVCQRVRLKTYVAEFDPRNKDSTTGAAAHSQMVPSQSSALDKAVEDACNVFNGSETEAAGPGVANDGINLDYDVNGVDELGLAALELHWNRSADGKTIFYKLVEHLKTQYTAWKTLVNVKHTQIATSESRQTVDQLVRNIRRLENAPPNVPVATPALPTPPLSGLKENQSISTDQHAETTEHTGEAENINNSGTGTQQSAESLHGGADERNERAEEVMSPQITASPAVAKTRAKRTCVKCGNPAIQCKGNSGGNRCANACRDCGELAGSKEAVSDNVCQIGSSSRRKEGAKDTEIIIFHRDSNPTSQPNVDERVGRGQRGLYQL